MLRATAAAEARSVSGWALVLVLFCPISEGKGNMVCGYRREGIITKEKLIESNLLYVTYIVHTLLPLKTHIPLTRTNGQEPRV
jgi:hypothetical protein